MYNDGKPITVDQLHATDKGQHPELVMLTEIVANQVMQLLAPIRKRESPMTDGICMTALACCVGVIQGELEAKGVVPAMTDECRDKMLIENFKAGWVVGQESVAERAAATATANDS